MSVFSGQFILRCTLCNEKTYFWFMI